MRRKTKVWQFLYYPMDVDYERQALETEMVKYRAFSRINKRCTKFDYAESEDVSQKLRAFGFNDRPKGCERRR